MVLFSVRQLEYGPLNCSRMTVLFFIIESNIFIKESVSQIHKQYTNIAAVSHEILHIKSYKTPNCKQNLIK